jgi:type II secretory pathway pseudopilin PulG
MDTTPSRPTRPRSLRRGLRGRAPAGFTLVEVLMATFVMLFAISSSILVMQSGFRSLDTARKTTLAAQIMQSEMERMRMLSWSRVEALVGPEPAEINISTIFPQNTPAEKQLFNEMSRTFTRTRTASYVSGTSSGTGDPGQIIKIDITISWRGIDGVLHERTSSTRYCKNGLYNYYYTLNKSST